MKTWYERLRDRRQELGLSQADIMRAVGVSNATASDWESGKTSPRGENLIKLCKHLRISTEWLVYGKGSLEDGQGPHPQPIAPGPEFVAIERINLKVSAGVTGFAIEHLNGNGPPIFFRADWLKAEGLRADRLLALRVSGDSMEPSLWDGDLVVINTAATEPKDGVAFVLNYEGEVLIKRLERDAGDWWLTSDNQRYKRKRCDEHAILLGQVIYKQSQRI